METDDVPFILNQISSNKEKKIFFQQQSRKKTHSGINISLI